MDVFLNDPWWLVLIKAVFALVFLLVMTLFTIWYERRVVGLIVTGSPAAAARWVATS